MKIGTRKVGEVVILDLEGKILIGDGCQELRDAVCKALDEGHNKILLNLVGVPYMDSTGLGEVIRNYKTVMDKGGKLKLLSLTSRMKDLMSMTKLLTVFEVFEVEQEALASF
ncbi:MAG: STAS domain-containing protein [Acidobacteriota bacterium]